VVPPEVHHPQRAAAQRHRIPLHQPRTCGRHPGVQVSFLLPLSEKFRTNFYHMAMNKIFTQILQTKFSSKNYRQNFHPKTTDKIFIKKLQTNFSLTTLDNSHNVSKAKSYVCDNGTA
jgi:hypothetical protein